MRSKSCPAKISERHHQKNVIAWFAWKYPQFDKLLVHVPNGQNVGERKGKDLKDMGVVKGFPDLVLFVPRNEPGLIVEMKTKGGRLHGDQPEVMAKLKGQGYRVEVCCSYEEAAKVIDDYLNRPLTNLRSAVLNT